MNRHPLAAPLVAVALILSGAGCSTPGTDNSATAPRVPISQDAAPGPTAAVPAEVLPAARAYVDAVNRGNLDALVAAFAPDGQVIDVSRRITGPDAIRRWADSEVIGGTLRVDAVTPLAPDTQRLRVHWAPAGSSGWAADYTFTVGGEQVVLADLQYAR
jgi:SnoaL-like domain